MKVFQIVLFIFLIVCAISVSFSKNLLNSIIIFMSYSLIMSIIWILLESPDLAITEAAVGAGITSILFFVTLKKIHAIVAVEHDEEKVTITGTTRRGSKMSRLLSEQEYRKTKAFKVKRWYCGEKDPYIGRVELRPQKPLRRMSTHRKSASTTRRFYRETFMTLSTTGS